MRILLKMAHLNARTVPRHRYEINAIIDATTFGFLGISETFICENTPEDLFEIPGYSFYHKDRYMKSRGGVGIYVKEEIPSKIKLQSELIQPEIYFIEITVGHTKIAVGVIYKSPLIPYGLFASLHETFVTITSKYEHVLIMGDCNIDYIKPGSALNFFYC